MVKFLLNFNLFGNFTRFLCYFLLKMYIKLTFLFQFGHFIGHFYGVLAMTTSLVRKLFSIMRVFSHFCLTSRTRLHQ